MRTESNGLRSPYKSRLMIGAAGFAAMATTTAAFGDGAAPPAAPDKWLPFAELGAGGDNHSGVGSISIFAPLSQTSDNLLFARVGVQTHFQSDNIESFSLGYRSKKENNWIFGGYIGVDSAQTDAGNRFGQFSFGVEALSTEWDAHLNAYIADQKVERLNDFRLDIHDTFIGIEQKQEAAFSGFDGEVGYRILHGGDGPDVRLFAGGFSFQVNDKIAYPTKNMVGPKAGVEVDLYALDFIGPQSRFSVTGEVRHDDLRGTTEFVGATVRIPMGNAGEGAQTLDELDRRMVDTPRRHDGVITDSSYNKSEPVIIYGHGIASKPTNTLLYVDNTAGHGDFQDPTTLPDATTRPGPNQFIVLTDNDGPTVHSGGATVRSGETLVSGGQTFTVKGVNSGVTIDHLFGPGVGPVSLDNPGGVVINLQPNATIYGVTITGPFTDAIYGHNISDVVIDHVTIDGAAGGVNGVHIVQDAPGDSHLTISNSSISNVSNDGVYIDNNFTGGTSTQTIHLDNTSIDNAGNDGFHVDTSVTGGATSTVDIELTSSPISGSGNANVASDITVGGGSTGTQNLVVDPTLISGGTYGVLVHGNADGGTLTQNITLADLDFAGQSLAAVAIYAYGQNGATITQTVDISNVNVTGSQYPIGLIADAFSGAQVTQNFALTNVTATGGYYDNIQIIGHADGADSVLHQDGTLDHITSIDSTNGDGVYIYGHATDGGTAIQHADITDLAAHGNYNNGLYAGVDADGIGAIAAQYVTVANSQLAGNYVGVSAEVFASATGVARQDLYVGNTVLSDHAHAASQFEGARVRALAVDGASAQQYAYFSGVTATDNQGSGIYIGATALFGGFAAQTSAIYGASNISNNAGSGVLVGAGGYYGGDVEQNVGIYNSSLNHNGANGLTVLTDSDGIAAGYYLYYSHVAQNIYAVGDHFDNNTGDGVRIVNNATYGAGIDQLVYLGDSTASTNGGDGIHIESHDAGTGYYGAAPGTHLYSDVYIYGGTVNHNGGDGISVTTTNDMPTDPNYVYGYSYEIGHTVVRDTDASYNQGAGFIDNMSASGIYSLNIQYVTLANSTFNHNGGAGAVFTSTDYYGPYSFGASIQNVTIQDSNFDSNGGDGLFANADASGFQGRAEQYFTISGASFSNNGGDGLNFNNSAHDGVYYPGYGCEYVQGVTGGCAFIRQTITIAYSDINDNAGDGLNLNTRVSDYGAVYASGGRPYGTPTLLVLYSNITGNGGDGVHIYSDVSNHSYQYQYAYFYGTHMDGNAGNGLSVTGNASGDSALVQRVIVYGGSTLNDNGGNGVSVGASTSDGGRVGGLLVVGYSQANNNGGDGIFVASDAYAGSATVPTGSQQNVYVVQSDVSHNGGYGVELRTNASGGVAITDQYLAVVGSTVGYNVRGVSAFANTYDGASANQTLYFAADTISHNTGDGVYVVAFANSHGFTAQYVSAGLDAPVTDITENGGNGITIGGVANTGGAVEQNLFLYNVNASGNTGDGLHLGSNAAGYIYGTNYYYYSHVQQNLVAAYDTFNDNGGHGVSISNNVFYGGQLDQIAEVLYSDLSNNGYAGFYESSRLTSVAGYGFSLGTTLNSDIYIVGDNVTNNGGAGIDMRSYAYGAQYIPGFGGYSYLTQHVQVADSTVDGNADGFVLSALQVGAYTLNAQYITLAASTFNHNTGDGARILATSVYGPGGFGDTVEQITIQDSYFSYNGHDGLRLDADSSGVQGRAEQHATISGSYFNHNGHDGIEIYESARDGVLTTGHPCDTVQGLPGGCAFIRQDVKIIGSDVSYNGYNGVSLRTYADNYGAIYGASGRPAAPTLLLYGDTINNNGNDGLYVHNHVSNNSYLYQYILALDTAFDNNGANGVNVSSYVAGASTMLQRAVLYSYNAITSASGNGDDGVSISLVSAGGSYASDTNLIAGVTDGVVLTGNGGNGLYAGAYGDGTSDAVQYNNIYVNTISQNLNGIVLESRSPGAFQVSYVGGNTIADNSNYGIFGYAQGGGYQYVGVYTFGNDFHGNGSDYHFVADGGSTQFLN